MRLFRLAVLSISLAATAPAGAQTSLPVLPMPSPHASHTPRAVPSAHPMPIMTFTNPAPKHGLSSASAQSCSRNATAAQQRVNPITGQPQAGTLVSIPITKGAGSLPSATNHQQQIEACAHPH